MDNGCVAIAACAAAERRYVVSSARAEGECVRVCVADQGRRILADDLERVFEPFFTTKPERRLKVGRIVCGKVIFTHIGCLWATNDAWRGTTFCVTVPAKTGEKE